MDSNDRNQKKCPFCSEEIPAGAGRCPYCGSLLEVTVDDNNKTIVPQEQSAQEPAAQEPVPQAPVPQAPAVNNAPVQNAGIGPKPGNSQPVHVAARKSPLSNGLKVFLTILFTVIPGLGQLAGIITAIVFMNADEDADRKSFGVALLVASLIMFVLSCIACFILVLAVSYSRTAAY